MPAQAILFIYYSVYRQTNILCFPLAYSASQPQFDQADGGPACVGTRLQAIAGRQDALLGSSNLDRGQQSDPARTQSTY